LHRRENAAPRPGQETGPSFAVPKPGYPGYWMRAFAGTTQDVTTMHDIKWIR
jgi:hypothetical protein